MIRRSVGALVASAMLIVAVVPAGVSAQGPTRPHAALPASLEQAKLAKPKLDKNVAGKGKVALSLAGVHGQVRVFVRLSSAPAAEFSAAGPTAVLSQVRANRTQQTGLIARATRLDASARVLARTDRASNVVALRIDASKLDELARDPSVLAINPDRRLPARPDGDRPVYRCHRRPEGRLQGRRDQGRRRRQRHRLHPQGVRRPRYRGGLPGGLRDEQRGPQEHHPRRAVSDRPRSSAATTSSARAGRAGPQRSGGGGSPIPTRSTSRATAPTSPTSSAGSWASPPRSSCTPSRSARPWPLRAPAWRLLQAVDWAVDPNHNGKTKDHLDILNMSLGSDYGSAFIDDLSLAVDQASRVGVLTVAASGNGGDKPCDLGHPGGRQVGPVRGPDPGPQCPRVPARRQNLRRPSPGAIPIPPRSTGRRSAAGSPGTWPMSAGAVRPGRSTASRAKTRTWPIPAARSP